LFITQAWLIDTQCLFSHQDTTSQPSDQPIEFERIFSMVMMEDNISKVNVNLAYHISERASKCYQGDLSTVKDLIHLLVGHSIGRSSHGTNIYVKVDATAVPGSSDTCTLDLVTLSVYDYGISYTTDELQNLLTYSVRQENASMNYCKAKNVVEKELGGTMTVESKSHQGTLVKVQIQLESKTNLVGMPVKSSADAVMETMLAKVSPVEAVGTHPERLESCFACDCVHVQLPIDRKVLIVDDSEANRFTLSRYLKKNYGFEVDEASNGKECIDKVEALQSQGSSYKLIILDNFMPVMTGPEAVYHLRKALGYQGVVFGLTGMILAEDLNHFAECGCDEVLAKPFNVDKFRMLADYYSII
jgi:CheY-like chemotaxis protein